MPYALPSFLKCCTVGSVDLLVMGFSDSHSYSCCFCYSAVLGSCSPFYTMTFAMHAGIACLHYACWDSLSGLHLHAGIACLAFLACDWLLLIGAYPRVSVVSMTMIGGYL